VKKYLLVLATFFLTFAGIGLFVLLSQQQTVYAAAGGAVCTGTPGTTGDCTSGLICTAPDLNDPGVEDTCVKTHDTSTICQNKCELPAPGEDCTGTCGTGETCLVNNPQLCAITQKDGDKEPAIQAACQKICKLNAIQGQSCGGNGQAPCFSGLICYANKCTQPVQTGASCTAQVNGNVQGNCANGDKCTFPGLNSSVPGYDPEECAHLGVDCGGGVQQGNTLGGGTCVNPNAPKNNPTEPPPPPSPPCQKWDANGVCDTFNSSFGGFSTNPADFIQKVFAVLLSISGGIALLLIIKAGYQLMTAQGNPEKLSGGRDQLIAAIVGLVFLIFSFVFLELIGFDILHLPGFGGTDAATGTGAALTCTAGSCIPEATCTGQNPGRCDTNGCPGGEACVEQ
jgi:hypothetical protein